MRSRKLIPVWPSSHPFRRWSSVQQGRTSSTDAMDAADPRNAETAETITDVVAGRHEDFSSSLAAVEAAGLGETLGGGGPFTVFAPTDEAFGAARGHPRNAAEAEERGAHQLDPHLPLGAHRGHGGRRGVGQVHHGQRSDLHGRGLDTGVSITDGQGNEVDVVMTDILTSNGVIHVIDGVVLPPQE